MVSYKDTIFALEFKAVSFLTTVTFSDARIFCARIFCVFSVFNCSFTFYVCPLGNHTFFMITEALPYKMSSSSYVWVVPIPVLKVSMSISCIGLIMRDPSKRFMVIETRFKNFINSLLSYFFADVPNSQDRTNGSVSHTSLRRKVCGFNFINIWKFCHEIVTFYTMCEPQSKLISSHVTLLICQSKEERLNYGTCLAQPKII